MVVFINSIFRIYKIYYPEVHLEECKYFVKEKKMYNHITDDIDILSKDSDWKDYYYHPDKEYSNE